MTSAKAKTERHLAFLERRNVKVLTGAIRGWENLSRYVPDTEAFLPKGVVSTEDMAGERFMSLYENLLPTLDEPDDLFRTLEPLTFFPWAEAAAGCPISYTGKNFWSEPVPEPGGSDFDSDWLNIYTDLIDRLVGRFGDDYPVGQPILRGPLDLAAAVYGDENMVYRFYDHPDSMKGFLDRAAEIFLRFVQSTHQGVPPFLGGSVLGSYYIWTPGTCLRLQEDAMALLSPDLYREFVHPVDCRIGSEADYTLFHLHASGLHLLDCLLENQFIKILQVSKDEGRDLEPILPALRKVQNAGKCLLLKGRLNNDDLTLIKKSLDVRGLCIQAVVLTQKEADDFNQVF